MGKDLPFTILEDESLEPYVAGTYRRVRTDPCSLACSPLTLTLDYLPRAAVEEAQEEPAPAEGGDPPREGGEGAAPMEQ